VPVAKSQLSICPDAALVIPAEAYERRKALLCFGGLSGFGALLSRKPAPILEDAMNSIPLSLTAALAVGCAAFSSAAVPADAASTKPPINIGVIAPFSAIDGASIIDGAEMAADDINAHGGVDGRPIKLLKYDDKASTTDAVRAFQRAVQQDHVVAMLGVFTSEVALAMEPWSGRLRKPFIITGAASNDITKHVREDYKDYKYTFHGWLNSSFLADSVCVPPMTCWRRVSATRPP
jgi:branched-chain amino acid transport system substrate-binding protein